jgi:hypothetical protein
MQSIRRVDPVSAMKVSAVIYAFIGLFIGVIISLISMAGFMAAASQDMPGAFRFFFGFAAVLVAPVFYGIIGAIGGLVVSAIYNLVAQFTGGIQIELG